MLKINTLNIYKNNFLSTRKKTYESFNFLIANTFATLIFIISFLLIWYVWMLNVNATKWYNIIEYEIQKKQLLMEKEILEVKLAELDSLTKILNKDNIKNMEKIKDITFLVIKNNKEIALNK